MIINSEPAATATELDMSPENALPMPASTVTNVDTLLLPILTASAGLFENLVPTKPLLVLLL